MLRTVLTIVQVFASLGIVALVLLQRGRGADAGAGFGAGASGTVFGARGATTGLSRATAVFAAIFMVNSLALAYLSTRPVAQAPKGLLGPAAQSAPLVMPQPAGAPAAGAAAGPELAPAAAPVQPQGPPPAAPPQK